jgi:hypothetical protein
MSKDLHFPAFLAGEIHVDHAHHRHQEAEDVSEEGGGLVLRSGDAQ